MSNVIPFSFSSLSSFETCPLRHYLIKVAMEVEDPPHESSVWGNRVHEAIEDYVVNKAPMAKTMRRYQRLVDKITSHEGIVNILAEQKLGIQKDYTKPCKFFSKDAWARGIIDLIVEMPSTLWLVDWKTGKRKRNFDQLKLFALFAFAHYPHIDRVMCSYFWFKEDKTDTQIFTRDMAEEIYAGFAKRVEKLEDAFDSDVWLPKKSGLCKNYCPVGRRNCKYCGI